MSSITVKTQFNGDIRRFNVDAGASSSLFASIQANIASSYKLTGRAFAINYIDEEGDACVVGGDEETREALRFAGDHGKVLKLNVVVIEGGVPTVIVSATPKAAAVPPAATTTTPAPTVLETKESKIILVRPSIAFVADVTIEDGSEQVASSSITKTWTVKNTNGAFNMPVHVVAVVGGKVAEVGTAAITTGATDVANVSVTIAVPGDAGRYKCEYHLVTSDGKLCEGDYQLWADFIVRPAVSASFIADITLEDGVVLAANSTARKVWSIKNDGTEQWPHGSKLVHNDGTVLPSPLFDTDIKGVQVPSASPNETVQVAVHVVAPSTSGRHHGEWHLVKPDGSKFANDYALWTQVQVPVPTLTPADVMASLPTWMEDESIRNAVDKLRASPFASPAVPSTPSAKNDVVHTGIICDGCGMSPIIGIRFKCSSCADYDLCMACEAKSSANGGIAGHNGEHSFVKMKVPFTRPGTARPRESKSNVSVNWRAPVVSSAAIAVPVAAATPKAAAPVPVVASPVKAKKPSVPRSQFKADITLQDGAQVLCGSVAVKRWAITNIGDDIWPEGTKLMFVGGALQPAAPTDSEPVSLSVVPLALPSTSVEVYARVQIPVIPGRHTGYFRLATADGKRFGHRLWLDVVAVPSQPVGTTPTPAVIGSSAKEVKAATPMVAAPVAAVVTVVAATPTLAPVVATKYGAELAQLKELGYRDEEMLKDLLQAAGGRVSQVVDWLVTPVV